MERASIKHIFITNMKKIHDDHIEEDMFINEQPEEPTTNIIDVQPEEPEQPTEEATTTIIDEQPEEPTTNIIDVQPEEPEQPTEEATSNIIDEQPKATVKKCIMSNAKNLPENIIGNIIDYIPGVTTSTINDDRGYYRYIKIYDIRLQYYEKLNMDISLEFLIQ